jgi:signal transduction histidine kinase
VLARRLRIAHWELAVAAEAVVLGLWIDEPGVAWAVVACALAVCVAAAAARSRKLGALATAVAAVAAAVAMLGTSLRVRAVEQRWLEVREALIQQASERLDATLGAAVDLARGLAAHAADLEVETREEAFAALDGVVTTVPPEHGVVILDETGRPWSWAGKYRVPPRRDTTELSARMTPFYVLLEARRQMGSWSAVGSVLLAADSAVPDQGQTVASHFVRTTGASLEFYTPGSAPLATDVFDYCLPSCTPVAGEAAPDTLFSVRTVPPSQGSYKLGLVAGGARWGTLLTLATLALLALAGGATARWVGVVGFAVALIVTPAGQHVGLDPLFNSAIYFHRWLGPLSASAGALLLAAALAVVALGRGARRHPRRTKVGTVLAGLLVLAAPYFLWTLARGITPPATGVGVRLWLSWQVSLAIVGVALGLAAALLLGSDDGVRRRGWTAWGAVAWAAALAVVGLIAWQPSGDWPVWYGLLWVPSLVLAIQPASRPRRLVTLTMVAGFAAALLTWGATLHGRLLLAERDAQRLRGGDPVALGYLDRFGTSLSEAAAPTSAAALYASWRRSPLSQDDYPAVLATWGPDGERVAALELAELNLTPALLQELAREARSRGEPVLRAVEREPGMHYVTAVPFGDGSVVTVGVAPRSRLIEPVLVGRFLRGERRLIAPYQLSLGEPVVAGDVPAEDRMVWRRVAWTVRATQVVRLPSGEHHLHAVVSLRDVSQLVVRGMLLVLLDVAILLLLGLAGETVSGTLTVPHALRDALGLRSYRLRLTVALAAFFVIPTLVFASWSIGRLRAEATRSRDLLIQQTLSDAVGTARQFGPMAEGDVPRQLQDLSQRLSADLVWYEEGVLEAASTAVLAELGLLGVYLPPDVHTRLALRDELEVTANAVIGGQLTRVGYRRLPGTGDAFPVLAAPRLVDVSDILREREDLAYGLLLVTILGVAGAAALAALAAHSLARPVQSLRAAAVAVGQRDDLPPFGPDVPQEFEPVMDAFVRMAQDVDASQQALEGARRRTATVLRNVATAVVALDRSMQVTIANPRAGELLEVELEHGTPIAAATDAAWLPVWEWVIDFMRSEGDIDEREFTIGARRIRAQVATLQTDPRGCVVALDDTTEMARAVRVLAWGELARQIAHEIKNPLTPIRLGVQHLQRARRQGRGDFDATLEQTAQQILAEIERLDAIARAFSRFGAPPAEAAALVASDLTEIARDAAALYSLGSGGAEVRVEAAGAVEALVRADEVKEVLINLIENARDAAASQVTIRLAYEGEDRATMVIEDDGRGITDEHRIHIFEPRFSTTSSGAGLGLAICKRLVESWGGTIEVESWVGKGTKVVIGVGRGE